MSTKTGIALFVCSVFLTISVLSAWLSYQFRAEAWNSLPQTVVEKLKCV